MKENQKFSPKYWVANLVEESDVVQATMSKSREDAVSKTVDHYGHDRCVQMIEDGKIEFVIVEIKIAPTPFPA